MLTATFPSSSSTSVILVRIETRSITVPKRTGVVAEPNLEGGERGEKSEVFVDVGIYTQVLLTSSPQRFVIF
jgi:hypothetical protein